MEVKLNKMLDTNYVNVDKDFCLNFHTWRLYDTEQVLKTWFWFTIKDK